MATADRSTPQTVTKLTGFQRDLLYAIAAIGPEIGLSIKEELESEYEKEINHGQLYPNLDTLAERGLIEKSEYDRRSHHYELTDRGVRALEERQKWAEQCVDGVDR